MKIKYSRDGFIFLLLARGEKMFCSLAYKDVVMIGRGLLLLIVVITLGLSVAEQQLSTLTLRQEFVRILAASRNNEGVYTLEVLDTSYSVSAMYKVGEIRNQDNSISILTPLAAWTIPKYLYFDCSKELTWLALQSEYVEQRVRQGWEMINVYLRQLR
jgi:hypothetical protein